MVDKDVNFEGLLEKESGIFKKKSSVWVVLDALDLSFYRPDKRSSCIGSVKVTDVQTIRKTSHTEGNQFEVRTDTNSYLFNAKSAELADEWINAVHSAMTHDSIIGESNGESHRNINTVVKDDTEEKDYNSNIPNISSSTNIFGVKLKTSIKRNSSSSPQTDSPSQPRVVDGTADMSANDKVITPAMAENSNSVNVQAEGVQGMRNRRPVRAPPAPPERKESLTTAKSDKEITSIKNEEIVEERVQSKRSPPSFKPPPPPSQASVRSNLPCSASSTGSSTDHTGTTPVPAKDDRLSRSSLAGTGVCQSFVASTDVGASSVAISGLGQSSLACTDEGQPSAMCPTRSCRSDTSALRNNTYQVNNSIGQHEGNDITRDGKAPVLNGEECEVSVMNTAVNTLHDTLLDETVQSRNETRSDRPDIELRERKEDAEVDTSGVEMRRSRRSNRNNSVDESWSRSVRSVDTKANGGAVPVVKDDENQDNGSSEELCNLENVLGSLISKGSNSFHTENQHVVKNTSDVTWDSEAYTRLKNFLTENTEYPFNVSSHKVTHANSVEKLRELLHN